MSNHPNNGLEEITRGANKVLRIAAIVILILMVIGYLTAKQLSWDNKELYSLIQNVLGNLIASLVVFLAIAAVGLQHFLNALGRLEESEKVNHELREINQDIEKILISLEQLQKDTKPAMAKGNKQIGEILTLLNKIQNDLNLISLASYEQGTPENSNKQIERQKNSEILAPILKKLISHVPGNIINIADLTSLQMQDMLTEEDHRDLVFTISNKS